MIGVRIAGLTLGITGGGLTVWGAWLGNKINPDAFASATQIPGLYARAQRPEDTWRYMVAQARSSRWVVIGAAVQFMAVVLASISNL